MTQVKMFIHFKLNMFRASLCPSSGDRLNTYIHAVHSARVPSTHYRSQHIQTNTRRGFIQSVS